jgi:hypothetical protein
LFSTEHQHEQARLPARCRKCGYELTGLRVEESCPECGTRIWPNAKELREWARDQTQATSDAFWFMIAAIPFWLLLPPLGLIVNIGAIVLAWRGCAMRARGRRGGALLVLATCATLCALGLAYVTFLARLFLVL